ncbi:hypothetical protein PX701_18345 [Agromyces sp. H3Y2-19a]|uniref:hypothetical protein n=1 Tax=Agromyces TaxID=33877 RepID=UPI0023B88EE9|nr:hypothetical protein [Agromyces chromiiresistens]MDF0515591.1 hypothetical protein [Agromyces chromiiresistens]
MSIDHEHDPSDSSDEVAEGTRAALADIEGLPIEERAPGYEALAARLREELEQSDPSGAPRSS